MRIGPESKRAHAFKKRNYFFSIVLSFESQERGMVHTHPYGWTTPFGSPE